MQDFETGMTNADGTTGCHPPGRGFESRRVRHPWTRSSAVEQVPSRKSGRRFITLVVMTRQVDRQQAQERRTKSRPCPATGDGSPRRFESCRVCTHRDRLDKRSGTVPDARRRRKKQPRRMPDGTTAPQMGPLREVRLLTSLTLSGTSGSPDVSSTLVAAADHPSGRCRQDYRKERPAHGPGGRVFNPPLRCASGGVAQQPSCQFWLPLGAGECRQDYR